jgi:hypothetical protein
MSDTTLTMDFLDVEEMQSSGGNFVDLEGKAHCTIQEVEVNAMRGEKIVRGFLFVLAVQAFEPKQKATKEVADSQVGRTFKMYFANGDPTNKDGGKFAQKKQAAALIAANVITPADLGKKGVDIDFERAINHQVCVEFALGKPDSNNKQWIDLHYDNIYHVDDPRATSFPKNAEILELAKDFRRPPEFFAALIKKADPKPKQKVTDEDLEGL